MLVGLREQEAMEEVPEMCREEGYVIRVGRGEMRWLTCARDQPRQQQQALPTITQSGIVECAA